jgi:hypothetical protein
VGAPGLGYRPGTGSGPGRPGYSYFDGPNGGWRPNHWGNHQNWHRGYCGGFYNGGWFNPWWNWGWGGWGGWGGGFWGGFGLGFGFGVSSWVFGNALWDWCYTPFFNPYWGGGLGGVAVVEQPVLVPVVPFDYSQPIPTEVAPGGTESNEAALAAFARARTAFQQGQYEESLRLVDETIRGLPNDAIAHEFRALVLFALGRYDEAASVLYAVLSAGPGWDWATLIGLYPSVDVYTNQLRAAEAYRNAHPQSPQAHFVLAYHYLTEGYKDAARLELRKVVELEPKDTLSAQLLRSLENVEAGNAAPQGAGAPPAGEKPADAGDALPPVLEPPVAAEAKGPGMEAIQGKWTASPRDGVEITLAIQADGGFTWVVKQVSGVRTIEGKANLAGKVLTLTQTNGDSLVGEVDLRDGGVMVFRLIGAGPEDPGLTFRK